MLCPWHVTERGIHTVCGHMQVVERFVYEAIANFLSTPRARVFVCDTMNTFDVTLLVHGTRVSRDQLAATRILRSFDVYGLLDALREVHAEAATSDAPTLVVVHSFSHPIGQLMTSGLPVGHALMVTLLRELRSMLVTNPGLSALLTTETVQCSRDAACSVSAFADTLARPALGTTFPHLVDSIWLVTPLHHEAHPYHYVAERIQSARTAAGTVVLFRIDASNRLVRV